MLVGKGILVSYDTCTNFPTIRKFSASAEWRAVIHHISKAYSVSLSLVRNVGSTIWTFEIQKCTRWNISFNPISFTPLGFSQFNPYFSFFPEARSSPIVTPWCRGKRFCVFFTFPIPWILSILGMNTGRESKRINKNSCYSKWNKLSVHV